MLTSVSAGVNDLPSFIAFISMIPSYVNVKFPYSHLHVIMYIADMLVTEYFQNILFLCAIIRFFIITWMSKK